MPSREIAETETDFSREREMSVEGGAAFGGWADDFPCFGFDGTEQGSERGRQLRALSDGMRARMKQVFGEVPIPEAFVVGENEAHSIEDYERQAFCQAFNYQTIVTRTYDGLLRSKSAGCEGYRMSSDVLVCALGADGIRECPIALRALEERQNNRARLYGAVSWEQERFRMFGVSADEIQAEGVQGSAGRLMRTFELMHYDEPELRAACLYLSGFAYFRGVVYMLEDVLLAAPKVWLKDVFEKDVRIGLGRIGKADDMFEFTSGFLEEPEAYLRTNYDVEASQDVRECSFYEWYAVGPVEKSAVVPKVETQDFAYQSGPGPEAYRFFCDWLTDAVRPSKYALSDEQLGALGDLERMSWSCRGVCKSAKFELDLEAARRVWVGKTSMSTWLERQAHLSDRGADHVVVVGMSAAYKFNFWIVKESQIPRRFETVTILLPKMVRDVMEMLHLATFLLRIRKHANEVVLLCGSDSGELDYAASGQGHLRMLFMTDESQDVRFLSYILMTNDPYCFEVLGVGTYRVQIHGYCEFYVFTKQQMVLFKGAKEDDDMVRTKVKLKTIWPVRWIEGTGAYRSEDDWGFGLTEDVQNEGRYEWIHWGEMMRGQRSKLVSFLSGIG